MPAETARRRKHHLREKRKNSAPHTTQIYIYITQLSLSHTHSGVGTVFVDWSRQRPEQYSSRARGYIYVSAKFSVLPPVSSSRRRRRRRPGTAQHIAEKNTSAAYKDRLCTLLIDVRASGERIESRCCVLSRERVSECVSMCRGEWYERGQQRWTAMEGRRAASSVSGAGRRRRGTPPPPWTARRSSPVSYLSSCPQHSVSVCARITSFFTTPPRRCSRPLVQFVVVATPTGESCLPSPFGRDSSAKVLEFFGCLISVWMLKTEFGAFRWDVGNRSDTAVVHAKWICLDVVCVWWSTWFVRLILNMSVSSIIGFDLCKNGKGVIIVFVLVPVSKSMCMRDLANCSLLHIFSFSQFLYCCCFFQTLNLNILQLHISVHFHLQLMY